MSRGLTRRASCSQAHLKSFHRPEGSKSPLPSIDRMVYAAEHRPDKLKGRTAPREINYRVFFVRPSGNSYQKSFRYWEEALYLFEHLPHDIVLQNRHCSSQKPLAVRLTKADGTVIRQYVQRGWRIDGNSVLMNSDNPAAKVA